MEEILQSPVRDFMTTKVYSVSPDTNVKEACQLFKKYNCHHLPVMDDDKNVVGMFTSNDALNLFTGEQSPLNVETEKVKVKDLMNDCELYYLNSNDSVKNAIVLFKQFNVHSAIILKDKKMAGILTSNDIIKLVEMEYRLH